uniref:Ras-like protein rasS n=1 Tax=Caligus rogercresseyi TaxID=217165 RepID=C1BRH2_CALRO|nr:Ras-like protein rasS precursor [Caligus rogercresseyi]
MGKKVKKGSMDVDGLIYTKVGIFGGGGVGKSCLTLRFQTQKFVEYYDPTILDSFLNKSFMVDGVIRPLEIMDTAGQDEYKSMLDLYLKSSDGFFMVYDVTDRSSFKQIPGIVKSLRLSRGIDEDDENIPPIIIIGNKCDLNERREVSFEEGKSLADELGPNVSYEETSAKEDINIIKVFEDIVRMVLKYKKKMKTKKKGRRRCVIM